MSAFRSSPTICLNAAHLLIRDSSFCALSAASVTCYAHSDLCSSLSQSVVNVRTEVEEVDGVEKGGEHC